MNHPVIRGLDMVLSEVYLNVLTGTQRARLQCIFLRLYRSKVKSLALC